MLTRAAFGLCLGLVLALAASGAAQPASSLVGVWRFQ